jgi:hypothetical protein
MPCLYDSDHQRCCASTQSPLQSLAHELFFQGYSSANREHATFASTFAACIESLFSKSIILSHEREIKMVYEVREDVLTQSLKDFEPELLINDLLQVLESIVDQDRLAEAYLPDLVNLRKVSSLSWPDLNYEHMMTSAKELSGIVIFVQERMRHRRVFRSEKGLIGLCPGSSAKDDEVWLLPGCSKPFVLRPLSNGRYMLMGEAYAYGLMYGEGLKWADAAREITIE